VNDYEHLADDWDATLEQYYGDEMAERARRQLIRRCADGSDPVRGRLAAVLL
jgi:hypothetical protein